MTELQKIEAVYYNAGQAFCAANVAVHAARAVRDAAWQTFDGDRHDLNLACDNIELAIEARDSARFHMFNAARALNSALDCKKDK